MEEPTNPGGGGGHRGGSSGASAGGGGVATVGGRSCVDDLDEPWPSRPSSAAAKLAQIWVDNPATADRFTLGFGGVDLDPEIWEVRIHFDGLDNLERKLGRDDITYLNLVGLIETQGYSIRDSIYCRKSKGMELIENNAKIYELLELFDSSKVLNLTVKRGRAVVAKKLNYAGQGSGIGQNVSAATVVMLNKEKKLDLQRTKKISAYLGHTSVL